MSLTEEQLALRRTGIGGSEIAVILGESRFASPFDVWLSKTQGWRVEETEDMRRGTFLEDGIAQWYAQRLGCRTERGESVAHASVAVARCTPDLYAHVGEVSRLVSIKSPRRKSSAWGADGSDVVPTEYALQLQWEHAVCSSHGALSDEMHLAALLDGDLCVYVVKADVELQAWMLDYATRWWARHVVGGEQPSLDGSSQAQAWLKSRFPRDTGEERPASPRETRLMVELELAQRRAGEANGEAEAIENSLRLSMGAATRIVSPSGVVTWKADKNGKRSFRTKWTNKEQQ